MAGSSGVQLANMLLPVPEMPGMSPIMHMRQGSMPMQHHMPGVASQVKPLPKVP